MGYFGTAVCFLEAHGTMHFCHVGLVSVVSIRIFGWVPVVWSIHGFRAKVMAICLVGGGGGPASPAHNGENHCAAIFGSQVFQSFFYCSSQVASAHAFTLADTKTRSAA